MRRPALILSISLLIIAACDAKPAPSPGPHREVVASENPSPNYSPAVRTGGLLFLSGNVGMDPDTRQLVPGGIGPETARTLTRIDETLRKAGLGMGDVVKCSVFLADMSDYDAMNQVYRTVWPAEPPARTTVQALPPMGARVEIECIAAA